MSNQFYTLAQAHSEALARRDLETARAIGEQMRELLPALLAHHHPAGIAAVYTPGGTSR